MHPRPWRPLQNAPIPHFTPPSPHFRKTLPKSESSDDDLDRYGGFGPNRSTKSGPSRRVSADAVFFSSYGAGRGRILFGTFGKVAKSRIFGPSKIPDFGIGPKGPNGPGPKRARANWPERGPGQMGQAGQGWAGHFDRKHCCPHFFQTAYKAQYPVTLTNMTRVVNNVQS